MKAWKQCIAGIAAMLVAGAASAAQEIQVWHALSPAHKAVFEEFVARFNKEQKDVVVRLSAAPSLDAMEAGVRKAVADKKPPHLVQLADDHAPEAVARDHRVQPLHELLAKYPIKDLQWFLPQTTSFVRDSRGRVLALPLMAEAPVLFYNRDLYQKAGLDPNQPPRTWRDLQVQLIKLQAAGVQCPYATSHMVWVHQENLSTVNNLPFASRNNGLDGGGTPQLLISDLLHVRHLSTMKSWVTSQLLTQASLNDESDALFASGQCAVLSSGTGAWGLLDKAKFSAGVAPLPIYSEAAKTKGTPLVGGSSMWVLAGHPAEEQRAVASFIGWLASPAVAAQWHQRTGFLPLTAAAARAADVSFYRSIPGAQQVIDVMDDAPSSNGRGFRLPQYRAVREILNEETTNALRGTKPPMQAQADAVKRAAAAMAKK